MSCVRSAKAQRRNHAAAVDVRGGQFRRGTQRLEVRRVRAPAPPRRGDCDGFNDRRCAREVTGAAQATLTVDAVNAPRAMDPVVHRPALRPLVPVCSQWPRSKSAFEYGALSDRRRPLPEARVRRVIEMIEEQNLEFDPSAVRTWGSGFDRFVQEPVWMNFAGANAGSPWTDPAQRLRRAPRKVITIAASARP